MKKLISTFLVSAIAFTTVASTACFAADNSTSLSNSTAALKELKIQVPCTYEQMEEQVKAQLSQLSPEEITNIQNALGTKEDTNSPSFLSKLATTLWAVASKTGSVAYGAVNFLLKVATTGGICLGGISLWAIAYRLINNLRFVIRFVR